jgi:hypothetical protein
MRPKRKYKQLSEEERCRRSEAAKALNAAGLNRGRAQAAAQVSERERRLAESIEQAKIDPGGREWRPIDALEWAIKHMWDETCPPVVPSGLAKSLWRTARRDPASFGEKFMPLLVKRDSERLEEEPRKDPGAEASLKLLDDWLAHYRDKRQAELAQGAQGAP